MTLTARKQFLALMKYESKKIREHNVEKGTLKN